MKMPPRIENIMFAPCGINCMVCYKHCYSKKTCAGCLDSDIGKPEHCRKCKIKECVKEKSLSYCYECCEFPCKQIKNLEKSYTTRYGESLVENSLFVKENGIVSFMKAQLNRFTCANCGGVISLHDAECSECKTRTK
ncbi:MAG: hypothetical protein CVV02_07350 [Firmicutes bacterium HGW-Firmicutes-7]|nr:MAG: hypothetical protein CVV02_07350 [Firmicutes bacterium HGW-Firmicutes-7]